MQDEPQPVARDERTIRLLDRRQRELVRPPVEPSRPTRGVRSTRSRGVWSRSILWSISVSFGVPGGGASLVEAQNQRAVGVALPPLGGEDNDALRARGVRRLLGELHRDAIIAASAKRPIVHRRRGRA